MAHTLSVRNPAFGGLGSRCHIGQAYGGAHIDIIQIML